MNSTSIVQSTPMVQPPSPPTSPTSSPSFAEALRYVQESIRRMADLRDIPMPRHRDLQEAKRLLDEIVELKQYFQNSRTPTELLQLERELEAAKGIHLLICHRYGAAYLRGYFQSTREFCVRNSNQIRSNRRRMEASLLKDTQAHARALSKSEQYIHNHGSDNHRAEMRQIREEVTRCLQQMQTIVPTVRIDEGRDPPAQTTTPTPPTPVPVTIPASTPQQSPAQSPDASPSLSPSPAPVTTPAFTLEVTTTSSPSATTQTSASEGTTTAPVTTQTSPPLRSEAAPTPQIQPIPSAWDNVKKLYCCDDVGVGKVLLWIATLGSGGILPFLIWIFESYAGCLNGRVSHE